jgi:hypothetical protein
MGNTICYSVLVLLYSSSKLEAALNSSSHISVRRRRLDVSVSPGPNVKHVADLVGRVAATAFNSVHSRGSPGSKILLPSFLNLNCRLF